MGRARGADAGGWRSRALTLLATSALATLAMAGSSTASAADLGNVALSFAGANPLTPLPGTAARPARLRRSSQRGISLTRSSTRPYWACPEEQCDAIVDPPATRSKDGRPALPAGPLLEGGGEDGGLDPQELRSAYEIPAGLPEKQTIAIVDAFGFEAAETDLATYRARYGLPPCTRQDGCFRRVNQAGEEANYPPPKESWETESALDIEMASAACPECEIVLVEATDNDDSDLAQAVDEAANLGANEISNSWGSPEEYCWQEAADTCEQESSAFDHPGVLITAAGGDSGYDDFGEGAESPEYPASLPSVVAVGGTSLHKAVNTRGWSEEVWGNEASYGASGSGCSRFPKPAWQDDSGCAGRMTNDVAAVAACETPVSVYNIHGWENICGTSVSTPLVAAIEAHASAYARSLPGADAFYEDPGALFDVTAGSNGQCTPPAEDEYFCTAQAGYDGPTGNGTPDGALELTGAAPAASTSPASAVTGSAATLNGRLDPEGAQTTYRFEYGTTSAYGTSVPLSEASAGSGTSGQAVSQAIAGLSAQTTYHYRIVAANGVGTTYGQDVEFTTAAPVVTGVEPASGPIDGGGSVTITGANLAGASAVRFGSNAALGFTVSSETSISAIAPSGHGAVDVTVTTPAGTSATSVADVFDYKRRGEVLAWGANKGALGDGQGNRSDLPVEASGLSDVTALAAGAHQSLALIADGRVMAWGENRFGELGDGTHTERRQPVGVCAAGVSECAHGPYLEEVTAIAAGRLQSLALLRDGTVMAWGGNLYGDLASDTERSAVPVPVCTKLESPCKPEHYLREVVAIAAGADFSLALLQSGTVMAWGENVAGELGDGSAKGPETCGPDKEACSRVPVQVRGVSDVEAIAAGSTHSLALLKGGTVMAWGANASGELGDGVRPDTKKKTKSKSTDGVPVAVCAEGEKAPCSHELGEVTAVTAGDEYSVALLRGGTVAAWGENFHDQLGDGSTSESDVPVAVSGLSEATAIAAGDEGESTLALLKSGELVSWGASSSGELGDGTLAASATTVGVCAAYLAGECPGGPYLSGEVSAMASGGDHELVSFAPSQAHPEPPAVIAAAASGVGETSATLNASVDPEGATVSDCHFEYGTTTAYGSSVPCSSPPGSGTSPVVVSATVSLAADTVYHFRAVATNSVGTTYGLDSSFATEPPSVTGVEPASGPAAGGATVHVSGAGFAGVSAVRFGSAQATGFEVESATQISAVAPAGSGEVDVTVTTPAGTSATGAADRFTYLPKSGGALAWGRGGGRLGDGGVADSDLPVEVSGLSEPVAVSAGFAQSLALLEDGEVMAWGGEDDVGEVGDGSMKGSDVPVAVCAPGVTACPHGPYLQEVVAVSAGGGDSLALLRNGTVYAWGDGSYGQLGDGSTAASDVPVPVCLVAESPCSPANQLQHVTAISAGWENNLALLQNGTVVAWGENEHGSLGAGTTNGPEHCLFEHPCSTTPVPVEDLSEVIAVSAGPGQDLALLKSGEVRAWGENAWGSLGDGSTKNSDVPQPVCAPGEDTKKCTPLSGVQAISAGAGFNLALMDNATVMAWGRNGRGQLGDGHKRGPEECERKRGREACSQTPVAIGALNEVVAVAAGDLGGQSLALLRDGTAMSWCGLDEHGELGIGSALSSDSPVPVCGLFATGPCPEGPFLSDVASIAVGGEHDVVAVGPEGD